MTGPSRLIDGLPTDQQHHSSLVAGGAHTQGDGGVTDPIDGNLLMAQREAGPICVRPSILRWIP